MKCEYCQVDTSELWTCRIEHYRPGGRTYLDRRKLCRQCRSLYEYLNRLRDLRFEIVTAWEEKVRITRK